MKSNIALDTTSKDFRDSCTLIVSVFLISICGLVYELLISSLSSYLLGSSILHFSITIGLFMSCMGIGSYCSKYIDKNLLDNFILIETLVGIVGGLSACILFFTYSYTEYYYLIALLLIAVISICIGLEVPIVTRILREKHELKDVLANILTFDYVGSLIGAVLFPLILIPYLGLLKTAFLVGALNLIVAFANAYAFRERIIFFRSHLIRTLGFLTILIVGFVYASSITSILETSVYQDPIVVSKQTKYQKLTVTQFKDDIRLFINGNLQFSSLDEYRYHEPLVHIPLSAVREPKNILILGGGDGLVAREVLKYPTIERIVLVDFDAEITKLSSDNLILRRLNKSALRNSKVEIVHADAFNYIRNNTSFFSAIIIDLPDPNSLALGKLYTKEFYGLLIKRLAQDGVMVTQATSPFFARTPFWMIVNTIESIFPYVIPFTSYVPSLGQWGFVMASKIKLTPTLENTPEGLRFLDRITFEGLFKFPQDISRIDTDINVLNNQLLVQEYEASWEHWN